MDGRHYLGFNGFPGRGLRHVLEHGGKRLALCREEDGEQAAFTALLEDIDVRGHLIILDALHSTFENGNHHPRDVSMNEDASRTWANHAPLNNAILNNIALAIIRRTFPGANVPTAQRAFQMNPEMRLNGRFKDDFVAAVSASAAIARGVLPHDVHNSRARRRSDDAHVGLNTVSPRVRALPAQIDARACANAPRDPVIRSLLQRSGGSGPQTVQERPETP